MEFKNLLQELKGLNLPLGHYAIFGSGPMAVRNIRETDDLDIAVSDQLWQEFANKYPTKKENERVIQVGNIEICKDVVNEEIIARADIIEGFPFFTLEDLMEFKKTLNRDKDKKDIKLIEEYLYKKTSI